MKYYNLPIYIYIHISLGFRFGVVWYDRREIIFHALPILINHNSTCMFQRLRLFFANKHIAELGLSETRVPQCFMVFPLKWKFCWVVSPFSERPFWLIWIKFSSVQNSGWRLYDMNYMWLVDYMRMIFSSGILLTFIMWVRQCHKPPMTGNGKFIFIPPIKMVMTGGWFMTLF